MLLVVEAKGGVSSICVIDYLNFKLINLVDYYINTLKRCSFNVGVTSQSIELLVDIDVNTNVYFQQI